MKYKFLNNLNESELQELENIILGIKSNEELLKQIESLKNKPINIKDIDGNFSSSYIPNYDEALEAKCLEILKQLKTNELFFFLNTFQNIGNTKYRYPSLIKNSYKEFENEKIVKDLMVIIDLAIKVSQYYNSRFSTKPVLYFDKVNNLFKYNLFQEDFEGPYNMLNYIKNYIYYLLKQKDEITTAEIFSDYDKKRELVTVQIRDISSYLCEIRNGTNLRLCIANAGLSRTANKTGEKFNEQQQLFIDALAFGTTLEKIENRNYEDYKRLLYLPTGKDLRK